MDGILGPLTRVRVFKYSPPTPFTPSHRTPRSFPFISAPSPLPPFVEISSAERVLTMSDSSGEQPWSDNPNAPQIPPWLHSAERDTLTGHFLGSILWYADPRVPPSVFAMLIPPVILGVVVILFFQCMGAFLDPVNKIRRSVKWALVVHTVALFLFLTLPVAADIWIPSTEFVDHRNFPGTGGQSLGPTGPIGYDQVIGETAINPALNVMFPLNQWLSDALLVRFLLNSVAWVLTMVCFSSSIVVMSFIL